MKLHLLLLGLVASSLTASAQQLATSQAGNKKVEYFDKDDHLLAAAEGADHRVETEFGDSTAGVQRVYAATGRLVSVVHYSDLRWKKQHGASEQYYPSGQLELITHFNQGKMEGEILRYHSNGKLQRREQFKDYKSLGGECFNAEGNSVPFFPHAVLPTYKGGVSGLIREIAANTKYPQGARRAGQEAKVLVDFIVSREGTVEKAHVREVGYPLLDAEALRVVNKLRRWEPGQCEGEPASVSFTLPVTFKLK